MLLEKILTAISLILLIIAIGFLSYEYFGYEEVTVFIKLEEKEDPFSALPKLIQKKDKIRGVREIDKSQNAYSVKIKTNKPNTLLDWILKNKNVEDAEMKD